MIQVTWVGIVLFYQLTTGLVKKKKFNLQSLADASENASAHSFRTVLAAVFRFPDSLFCQLLHSSN